jgi:RNA polymerase sigma factor (sigma-70 family)
LLAHPSSSDAPLTAAPAGIETFRRRMADRSDVAPAELQQLMYATEPSVREEAWASLVAKHSRLLLNVARGVAAEHDGAMDAYAYVLERLREDDYRRLRGYMADGRSAFSTWLVVVARRLCVDHYRGRYGRAPRGQGDVSAAHEGRTARRKLMELATSNIELSGIADDDTPAPDAALRAIQLDDALAAAVASLPPADQLLVKLRFDDGLPVSEIAAMLRFPSIFHVYRRISAVCATLRRSLAARGVESGAP